MIVPEAKLCPVPPISAGRLCIGKMCAWFNEDKKKCAVYLMSEGKTPSPKKKNDNNSTVAAT